jgi:hypothetical protein
VGESIAIADDELLEAVARVEGLGELWLLAIALRIRRSRAGSVARTVTHELDANALGQDVRGTRLEDSAKSLRDPGAGRDRSVDDQDFAVEFTCLERSEPNLERRLLDRALQRCADLAPGFR